MAREEQHREDLMAEATALVERVSLELAATATPVVMGFRRDHGASIYFDADRVYQFTSGGQLRRAFVDELLYKAERGRLVAMRRQRGAQAVELISHPVDESCEREFLAEMPRAARRPTPCTGEESFQDRRPGAGGRGYRQPHPLLARRICRPRRDRPFAARQLARRPS